MQISFILFVDSYILAQQHEVHLIPKIPVNNNLGMNQSSLEYRPWLEAAREVAALQNVQKTRQAKEKDTEEEEVTQAVNSTHTPLAPTTSVAPASPSIAVPVRPIPTIPTDVPGP